MYLGSTVPPWLRVLLDNLNTSGRPLIQPCRCAQFLKGVLDRPTAEWTLASVMLPSPLWSPIGIDNIVNRYACVEIEAYVVYVDMSTRHEVLFKLLPRTVNRLLGLHEHACSGLVCTFDQAQTGSYLHALREAFARTMDAFVYAVDASALQGLGSDGSGELLAGQPEMVKSAILEVLYHFLPLGAISDAAEWTSQSLSRSCRCWRCVTMHTSPLGVRADCEAGTKGGIIAQAV